MNEETEELLKEIKSYRNDMVARNYPFQEISDIITRWEMRDVPGAVAPSQIKNFLEKKTVSEELQNELEPIKDFLEEAEKEKKELADCLKEARRQTKERT
tara:strand:+ start:829 stop:1128 length:300 start_codon:yes stop_codon:yes gene_type:complete